MATIKLNSNGKVITKDNKVSCECCDPARCLSADFDIIGKPNTFEISKNELLDYYNGGTWNVSGNITVSLNWPNIYQANGSGQGNFSAKSQGCSADLFEIKTFFLTVIFSQPNNPNYYTHTENVRYGLLYRLYALNKKYYINICALVEANIFPTRCGSPQPPGYGGTPTANVDGNDIALYSLYRPAGTDYGLINLTTSNLTATFTPDT